MFLYVSLLYKHNNIVSVHLLGGGGAGGMLPKEHYEAILLFIVYFVS